jgi:hypothetical protein
MTTCTTTTHENVGVHNIAFYQGNYYTDTFNVLEDGVSTLTASHLVKSTVKTLKSSDTAAFEFTCSISDFAAGDIVHSLSSTLSANIPAGIYYYDLITYLVGGTDVKTWLEGTVEIIQSVTQV